MTFEALRGWTPAQKHVVFASFLGWTLDAFDYFLLIFVLKDVAAEFGVSDHVISYAVMATLAMRPVGAFILGRMADRFGRRPVLMLDVALYSVLGFATAFSPNLIAFLIIRACFGIAMGGEWGIGASLTMEHVKPQARGLVSGLLQSGYPMGYLLASLAYGLLYSHIGWRGLFMVGIVPALLIFYIRRHVPESPSFDRKAARKSSALAVLKGHWKLALYAVLLMTAFNFFSHGTQDLYPTFLQKQHGFDSHTVGTIAVIYNIGAIIGGFFFGILSQRFGRRRTMIAAALLAVPAIWLWVFSSTALLLGVGAFTMQFFVQGAWGVIPAHLNELSPPAARGAFPGTVYQIGNFIASVNLPLQTMLVGRHQFPLQAMLSQSPGGYYALALGAVIFCAAIAIALLLRFGPEAHNAVLNKA